VNEGSPPRMRGTRGLENRPAQHAGITPAHAGNTDVVRGIESGERDHPRACGEHLFNALFSIISMGSPPRMRGTHELAEKLSLDTGITPAHAGNTKMYAAVMGACRDHPRACGEHVIQPNHTKVMRGSPPRMRGTRHLPDGPVFRDGITPAHAGNTCLFSSRIFSTRDHPRACGEHKPQPKAAASKPGSPPRMRGTRDQQNLGGWQPRITPAHAGNTSGSSESSGFGKDHPRACGEHDNIDDCGNNTGGSPPRMRGTHFATTAEACDLRITPAHAGNTT